MELCLAKREASSVFGCGEESSFKARSVRYAGALVAMALVEVCW
jgi:hypothetical protein